MDSNRAARFHPKQTLAERRAGELALSEFTDYVQQQQMKPRHHHNDSAYGSQAPQEHAELDILDSMGLSDDAPQPKLKHMFLDTENEAESITLLQTYVDTRLNEGHGEAVFDIGIEDNGDDLALTRSQWDAALARLGTVAEALNADCRLLLTKNVGGPVEAEPSTSNVTGNTTASCGKLMIRRRATSVSDCIEIRIAVVGNGT